MDFLLKRFETKHERYWRIFPDEFYESLSKEDLHREWHRLGEDIKSSDALKILHRQRFFACWHDGSTISNASHFLIMFSCCYDPAIFYTDDEYFEKTGAY